MRKLKRGPKRGQNVTKQDSGTVHRYFCNLCFFLCHFMVSGLVKFATFQIFVTSAHLGVEENILANYFAIFGARLEPPFLV